MGDLISRQAAIDALDCINGVEEVLRSLPSAQPNLQPTCNQLATDIISRQAAIDLFPNDDLEWDTINGYIAPHVARRVIKQLPTIQPEPKEGHWIDKGDDGDWAWQIDGRGNSWHVWGCSECGKSVFAKSSYCPHCGAKMQGADT